MLSLLRRLARVLGPALLASAVVMAPSLAATLEGSVNSYPINGTPSGAGFQINYHQILDANQNITATGSITASGSLSVANGLAGSDALGNVFGNSFTGSGANLTALDGSNVASGLVPLAHGGTDADLSATGGAHELLEQTSAGAAISVAALGISDLPSSGVTAGTYGSAADVATFSVDAEGLVTGATSVPIAISGSQVSGAISGDSGGVTGGYVSSFDARTGAVTLTSSDVTTALRYTPVNKAGDTMSGALTIAGPSSSQLYLGSGTGQSSLLGGVSFLDLGPGTHFDGSNFVADQTSASLLSITNGLNYYYNSGLTVGTSFSPALQFSVSSSGVLNASALQTGGTPRIDSSGNATLGSVTVKPPDPSTNYAVANFENTSGYGIYLQSSSVIARGNTLDWLAKDYNLGNGVATHSVLSMEPDGDVLIGGTTDNGLLSIGSSAYFSSGGSLTDTGETVNGTVQVNGTSITVTNSGGNAEYALGDGTTSWAYYFNHAGAYASLSHTGSADVLNLFDSNRVGIDTTTDDGTDALQVNGSGKFTGALGLNDTSHTYRYDQVGGGFQIQQMPSPGAPSVTVVENCNGTGLEYYWVVAHDAFGGTTLISATGNSVYNGNNPGYTCNGYSQPNTNDVSWASVAGATSYDLLRSTSSTPPYGTGAYAVATGITATSFVDDVYTLASYTVPARNNTADSFFGGSEQVSGALYIPTDSQGVSALVLYPASHTEPVISSYGQIVVVGDDLEFYSPNGTEYKVAGP